MAPLRDITGQLLVIRNASLDLNYSHDMFTAVLAANLDSDTVPRLPPNFSTAEIAVRRAWITKQLKGPAKVRKLRRRLAQNRQWAFDQVMWLQDDFAELLNAADAHTAAHAAVHGPS